jgi:putative phosphoserine phosphatase/1-acylglycerol-3-phosphate O-acyltransferase
MMAIRFLRSCYHWAMTVGTMMYYVLSYPVVLKFKPKTDPFEYFWSMSKYMTRWSGIDLTVKGLENLDRNKAYILTFNHINVMDHVVIYNALHTKLTGLQKEANLSLPIYGTLMRQFGIIPIVPRGDTPRALKALEVAKEKFRQGISILIAPEGTRSRDGQLGSFKKGGFHMAIDLGADILPLILDAGMHRYNKRRKFMLKPGPVTLKICPPISTQGYTKDNIAQLTEDVRNVYVQELGSENYETAKRL